MAIGPAMVLGGLGILALVASGKSSKTSSAPSLPSGPPPGAPGSLSDGQGGIKPGIHATRVPGPIPVMLPDELAVLMAKSLRDLTVNDDGTVSGPVTAEAVQRATTVAAQIDAAGFPDAANAFRAFIQRASSKVPSPPKDKQIQLPGIPQSTVDQINRTILLERDPAKLQKVLDAVRSMPQSAQRDLLIEMLSTAIQQTQAALVLADTLKKTDEVLKSPGLPPVSTVPGPVVQAPPVSNTPTMTLPEIVITPGPSASTSTGPAPEVPDTQEARRAFNVANSLRNLVVTNGNDVKKAKGKEDKGLVMAFQRAEGLGADGKTGPGTVLKMAKYVGDIPYVFYWPVSATAKAVLTYRSTLQQMADAHESAGRPGIAAKLRAAASRERGQAGIVGQMPA